MELEGPPETTEFNYEWTNWLFNLYVSLQVSTPTVEIVTTPTYAAGLKQVIIVDDDTAGGPVSVELPLASSAPRVYQIKKIGSTGDVTIAGSENIDGSTGVVLNVQYQSVTLVPSDQWYIV